MHARRKLLVLAAAGALAPLAALAQPARKATVAVLIPFPEADAESRIRLAAFTSGLEKLGWREGHNLRLEARYAVGDAQLRRQAGELAALDPAVILIQSNQALAVARQQNIAIPTVFVAVSDPVGSGFAASLSRPGGNATGFANFAPEMGAKWLQVLRELAPHVEKVIVLLNPTIAANRELARSVETAAVALGVGVTSVASGDGALDQAIVGLAGDRRTGIVVMPNPTNTTYRRQIIDAAARHRLPAIYPFPYFAKDGGLVAYGLDIKEMFRLAAAYVDRILRGARPAELPVQQPTKYELVINQRAARALGLSVPATLLVLADEVIE